MKQHFTTKDAARRAVWNALENEGVARFPFPPHGRIPNFEGAKAAAARLFDHPLLEDVHRIKVNPDAPQRFVRAGALERGITVFVPTPRLRGGFKRLDPSRIPDDQRRKAASLSNMDAWAESVDLDEVPQLDLIVVGCVVVTRESHRCGKGEGYSDLEYAILRELGHDPVPVMTTVHSLQIVDAFPTDVHDVPLSAIVTPEEAIDVSAPPAAPEGIDWDKLSRDDLQSMPILAELKRRVADA